MTTLKLTYFDAPGRAEPIRLAMALGGLDFEDHRITFPQFQTLKQGGKLALGSVPVLEVDGVQLAQTSAILRFVARLGHGQLYPDDPVRGLVVDSALDSVNDTLSNALMPSLFERDMAKKLAMREEIANGVMKRVFRYVENLLDIHGGPLLGGDTVSIADLVVATQVRAIRQGKIDGITEERIGEYRRILALVDAVEADPRVRAYRAR